MVHLPFLRSSAERSAQPIWQSVRWKNPTNNHNSRNSDIPASAQIEAQRAKIDCSRKQLTNDGPNRQGQFINPDEIVAYSSVYYLNIPINKRIPINMLATIISADHLLIYRKGSELINTRIVHFNQLLERSRAYFFAMRPKPA